MGAGEGLTLERQGLNTCDPQSGDGADRLPPEIAIRERRPAKLDIESVPRVERNERPQFARTQRLPDDAADAMRLCVGNEREIQSVMEGIGIPSDEGRQPLDGRRRFSAGQSVGSWRWRTHVDNSSRSNTCRGPGSRDSAPHRRSCRSRPGAERSPCARLPGEPFPRRRRR